MPRQRTRSRVLGSLLAAGALSIALVGGAAAAIYVYDTSFGSKKAFREMKKSAGAKNCDKGYREKSESMRISVTRKKVCAFSPPVVGDATQPNHVIRATGQALPKQTPKSLREAAYLVLRVREGRGGYYELRVRPRGKQWKLLRHPSSNAFNEGGKSKAIRSLKKLNNLRLSVKGGRVSASVNGKKLTSALDANPGQIDGRKTAFGLGNRKDSSRAIVGVYERVRVGISE
jgi:hypothetical protein